MTDTDGIFRFSPRPDASGLRIGIVVARFNREIGDGLLEACVKELRRLGAAAGNVSIAEVPGALEIPLALQKLANSGRVDALVALGAVIRGETYHFEVVSNESASGIMSVQLDTGIPVANGVLTCETEAQAQARVAEKGRDCAQAAVEMAVLMKAIDERQ
jgi:6,7-dimethyl-8-ribityllumazine synthase